MKCPKCGFHSFEHLDACKKCQSSLVAFKTAHKITPVIVPRQVTTASKSDSQRSTVADDPDAQDNFLIDNPAIFSAAGSGPADPEDSSNDSVFGELSFTDEPQPAADMLETAWDSPASAIPLAIGADTNSSDLPDLFGDTSPLNEAPTTGESAKKNFFEH